MFEEVLTRAKPEIEDPASFGDTWQRTDFLLVGCQHEDTICVLCLPQWASAYEITIDGAAVLGTVL